jgi:tetratricopeptide (TPR) repeat protein
MLGNRRSIELFSILMLCVFLFGGCNSQPKLTEENTPSQPIAPAVANAGQPAPEKPAFPKPFEPNHPAAKNFFEQGNVCLEKKDYEQAIACFQEAIRNYPRYAAAYSRRGDARLALGNLDQAFSDYSQAIIYDRDDVNAYLGKGYIFEQKNDPYVAAVNYSEAILRDPRNLAIYKYRANAYFNAEEYGRALDDLTIVVQNDPHDYDALCRRGLAYEKSGDRQTAIADYTAAILLEPNSSEAYYRRACARIGQEKASKNPVVLPLSKTDLAAALQDANRAIDNESAKNAAYYRIRATIYESLGDVKKAIGDLTEAIASNPRLIEAYCKKGELQLAADEMTAAWQTFTAAIEANPQSAEAYYGRGMVELSVNLLPAASDDFTSAIRIDPKYAAAYRSRGDAYRKNSNLASAIDNYSDALRLDIADATAVYRRAQCYYQDKQYYQALSDCEDMLHLKPGNVPAMNLKGCIYIALKENDKAIEQFSEAAKLIPNDARTLNNLGAAYLAKNDLPAAMQSFDKSLENAPDDVSALHNRALAQIKMSGRNFDPDELAASNTRTTAAVFEDIARAQEDLRAAINLNKRDPSLHFDLALACLLNFDYQTALKEFDSALDLNPALADAYYYRSQLFRHFKNSTEADADFQKWKELKALRKSPPASGRAIR